MDTSNRTTAVDQLEFAAIRGRQAGREYYVSMCRLGDLPRLFKFNGDQVEPHLRAQRAINKSRVPEIQQYILENRSSYVFSAITASIDGDVCFEPVASGLGEKSPMGTLKVAAGARFLINDGQHRKAGIEAALVAAPELADETIAVVMFVDLDLSTSQQVFADLNRHAIRPSASLAVLYDHRSAEARVARDIACTLPAFKGLVEMERTALPAASNKLFTLSAINLATTELMSAFFDMRSEDAVHLVRQFWTCIDSKLPQWGMVRRGQMLASEVRSKFVHPHSVLLQAIARVGAASHTGGVHQAGCLQRLTVLDWSRSNTALWEGRCMLGGTMAQTSRNVVLTTNILKLHLGLELTEEERDIERTFRAGRSEPQQ